MSWFNYGTPKKRSWRKGAWLRVRCLSSEILAQAEKFMRENESIRWVEIDEIQKDGFVLLELWCREDGNPLERYNVFHIRVQEDPNWVCEGDMGRGIPKTEQGMV